MQLKKSTRKLGEMVAKELLDELAKSCGFDKGVRWMGDCALMFIKGPDPLDHVQANDWIYVRSKQQQETESYELGKSTVVRAFSWNDAACKVCKLLEADGIWLRKRKIDKSSPAAAKFMIECVLSGLAEWSSDGS